MKFSRTVANLLPHDLIVILFAIFLIILNLIFYKRIEHWLILIIANFVLITIVLVLSYADYKSKNKIVHLIKNWYIVFVVLITFKMLYYMVYPIHGRDYDEILIEIDRMIFGVDPTVYLVRFANPILTEIIQIAYSSFYFLFLIAGYELFKNKDYEKFQYAAFLVVYGFYLSYIGYFILPAIGPRFTLHDFYAINRELPGIFLTNFLRDFVNFGESISSFHPQAAELVQRDVFPSGHTQLTLVLMYISAKYKMKTRWFLWITGTLLIVGTVYLRYHYVIDLIVGALFMWLTVWSAKYIYSYWNRVRQILDGSQLKNRLFF